jgi:crotonobetainyl-CoA:carnitine CoA-transferase CaiB-like acyl-CoA transferase
MMAEMDFSQLPLDGVRVLDLSRIIAGPMATGILADFGADVIKIEEPSLGDPSRAYVAEGDEGAVSPVFEQLNRNKRSICVNLKDEAGIDVLYQLIRSADVLVHNYRPGVAERLGFSYGEVSKVNPALVYCAISGAGEVGPLRTYAANDVITQAYSGVMSFTGERDGSPVRCGPPIADMTAGLYAAIAVMIGLFQRGATKLGCEVRTSLLEGQLSFVAPSILEYMRTGFVPQPMGSETRVGLPNGAFPTADGHVVLAAVDERVWVRLCAALGIPETATDSRFKDLSARRANREALFEVVAGRTRNMSTHICVEQLSAAGVPCAPINTIADVVESAQVAALGVIADKDCGGGDLRVPLVLNPITVAGRRPGVRSGAPMLGQNEQEVFAELER